MNQLPVLERETQRKEKEDCQIMRKSPSPVATIRRIHNALL